MVPILHKKNLLMKVKSLFLISSLIVSCTSTSKFTGFSYDPPGVTDTSNKVTLEQKKRTIGAGFPKVWVSNEFESARAIDFYHVNEDTFEVAIEPENHPINNSPWYGFNIWSDEDREIYLKLRYKEGRHRYVPKLYFASPEDTLKQTINNVSYDDSTGSSSFKLALKKRPYQISAHFLDGIRFSDLQNELTWINNSFIRVDTVGYSHQKRPIIELTVNEASSVTNKGILALLSRQHPPEVSGYKAYQAFFKTLISDSELATTFRKYFVVKAYPIINPDGVVNGHWRHNVGGVDLNRDWINFNQPETRAVRDALLRTMVLNKNWNMYYGIDFHSTNENIFYPILQDIKTFPDNISQRWFPTINEANPELNFVLEEFDTTSPIAKNWIYRAFGSDALTFEVYDELSPEQIQRLGTSAAQSLMELLIKEWKNKN